MYIIITDPTEEFYEVEMHIYDFMKRKERADSRTQQLPHKYKHN